MQVVLCHPADDAALWLHKALRSSGVTDLELVSVEQLVYSQEIIHRMDALGDSGEIRLEDKRVLRPEDISTLINRIRYIPGAHFDTAGDDRGYAFEELSAFLLAWLDSLAGPVINRPLPGMLDGGNFAPATMHHQAAVAGLAVAPWVQGSTRPTHPIAAQASHRLIVYNHRVFGPVLPRDVQDACRRLAILLGLAIAEIGLAQTPLGWTFTDATGSADFRRGGSALVAAIADTLGADVS